MAGIKESPSKLHHVLTVTNLLFLVVSVSLLTYKDYRLEKMIAVKATEENLLRLRRDYDELLFRFERQQNGQPSTFHDKITTLSRLKRHDTSYNTVLNALCLQLILSDGIKGRHNKTGRILCIPGPRGPRGPQGRRGRRGPPGKMGPPGPPGNVVYVAPSKVTPSLSSLPATIGVTTSKQKEKQDKQMVSLLPKTIRDVVRPRIVSSPSTVSAREGENVTIPCKATGYPTPRITWSKDGNNLITNGRYRLNGSELSIISLMFEDQGVIHCLAENMFEKAKLSINLTVYDKP